MKILLVDDDKELIDWIGYGLKRGQHKILFAYSGEAALRVFDAESPDLVVLDLGMPRLDGMQVLKEIRRRSRVPVIILSAMSEEERVVEGLRNGADDYVIKPFRIRELQARIEAGLRRGPGGGQPKVFSPIDCGDLRFDPRLRQVTVAGKIVALSPLELNVLEYLLVNHGIVVRLSDLIANAWGYDAEQNEHVVHVTIYRLRRKLEGASSKQRYIHSVPGEGYILEERELPVT